MCGLVGLLTLDRRPPALPLLRAMADRIHHRGPDGEGHALFDGAGFYHKRLAIIDPERGQQPMMRGPLTLVFNGEIYNYVELREELRRAGHEFVTGSDTEVILALYAEHGEDAVRRLNGMFAFLLHDARRNVVIAARDHFGIKPLYYHRGPSHLAFASEIKALFAHPDIAPQVDHESLADYLTFQFTLGDTSLFRGVRTVAPGHYHVVELATLETRAVQYWSARFAIDEYHTEAYFVERVQWLLDDAVRIQLRSDVPVGAHLSGGMDSSLVALLASRHLPGRLRTFTGAFDEGRDFDESEFAREVARTCEAEAFEIRPTAQQFVDALPKLVYYMDHPAAGPGVFPQYMVSQLAARHVKVALGGQGGDEIFGGYTRYLVAYFEQALKGAIYETNEEHEHIVSLSSILPNLPTLQQYVPMLQEFWRGGLFAPMSERYFRLINRGSGELGLLSPEFRAMTDPCVQFERFQAIFDHPETRSYYNKMTHFDLVTSLPALLQVEDRTSMACSLESRVPLLDYRLVELVTSMPPVMKFRGGELKYILKRALGSLLPPAVQARKDKMGFPVPLDLWLSGPARSFVADVLCSEACRTRGIFAPKEIERLLAGPGEARFGRRLWGLLNVELWHREFIDAH
jgi:asparagine synthase (glutamine-hydrolysing)